MSRTMEMGRIKTVSEDGRKFTIIKYTEFLDAGAETAGSTGDTYKTTSGMHASFKGDGKFEISELNALPVTTRP